MQLVDKTIVITGGTSGIGLELVKRLYRCNHLIVLAQDNNRLGKLKANYPNVTVYQIDLTNTELLRQTASHISKSTPSIDLLIHSAAVQKIPTFLDDDFIFEEIEKEIKLNFTVICQLTYLLLNALRNSSESIIFNINSGLAIVPKKSSAVYCGTKGALNLFSQSLRFQLEETNIKVLQAFLPVVDTPMAAGREEKKLPVEQAALEIIRGIKHEIEVHDIGKVKLLRYIHRLMPSVALKIMKRY